MSKALLPLLTGSENSIDFLDFCAKESKEIVVLLVIDTKELIGKFGFASNSIMQGTNLLEDVKEKLEQRKINVIALSEWGETLGKIENSVRMHSVNKVLIKKHSTHYWKQLIGEIEKRIKAPIVVY